MKTLVGHYCLEVKRSECGPSNDRVINLEKLNSCLLAMDDEAEDGDAGLEKELLHLHRQFGHPCLKRWNQFTNMCRPDVWTTKKKKIMEDIYKKCKTCKIFTKTPFRPVVKLPVSCEFNER